jgi:murein tripeptide amidase MpaA
MTGEPLARKLLAEHERYSIRQCTPARCTYGPVRAEVQESVRRGDGLFALEDVGFSLEGRALYTVRFGRGEQRILLWTQMHGDEPTATLALLDVLRYLVAEQHTPHVQTILEKTTVVCLPMLNPDGAERYESGRPDTGDP